MILDTRRIKKLDKYPVKLRITFLRVTKYYQTIFNLSKDDWAKLSAPRVSGDLQIARDKLKEIEQKSSIAAREMIPFDFAEFEKTFVQSVPHFRIRKTKTESGGQNYLDDFDYAPFHKKYPILTEEVGKPGMISYAYLTYIKRLIRQNSIGTGILYQGSYNSLTKFGGDVPFTKITVAYLTDYETWLRNKNISKTTMGIYIRPLRTLFNEAIEEGIIKREKCYPFGKRKYRIPTSRNVKKALDLSEIKQIYYYQCDPKNESEQRAKDFWLFSYFANGMNPKDIALIKYKNIHDDFLIFDRSKTEHHFRSDPRPISVFISDEMKEIMERWANKDKSPNNYIFPILESGVTPLRQYELVQLFVRSINDWMDRIVKSLGITRKATTYVARHSFSTVLKRSGASTEFIQNALGHTDVKTTENYLGSFDNDVIKQYAGRLSSFKAEPQQAEPV